MTKKITIDPVAVNSKIVNWLRDYAINAKSNGFIVGVSGGIDSAVTSSLCAQTGLPTWCVEMPIHQAENQVARSLEHITQLKSRFPNVQHAKTDLTEVFETFKSTLPSCSDLARYNLTLANTRARIRMTTLYFHAGIHGALVAGTGNKIEDFGVGFYTKYGDGGVDISPIADLMKSEVYTLGAYLNVPESILNAAPTDGLFGDDRTDEDQLGASYDELEWAMTVCEQGDHSGVFNEREKIVLGIYKRLNAINQHKMVAIPVCKID